jgi:hypothetical protein
MPRLQVCFKCRVIDQYSASKFLHSKRVCGEQPPLLKTTDSVRCRRLHMSLFSTPSLMYRQAGPLGICLEEHLGITLTLKSTSTFRKRCLRGAQAPHSLISYGWHLVLLNEYREYLQYLADFNVLFLLFHIPYDLEPETAASAPSATVSVVLNRPPTLLLHHQAWPLSRVHHPYSTTAQLQLDLLPPIPAILKRPTTPKLPSHIPSAVLKR